MDTTPLQRLIAAGLRYNCPDGYVTKNEERIARLLERSGGVCPCHHEEWSDETPFVDKCCPCSTFRKTGDCHCGLYVSVEEE